MNFAYAARTNWNFDFTETAKIFNINFTTRLKKMSTRLLSMFGNIFIFFRNKRIY